MQCHQQDVSDSSADDSPQSLYERLGPHTAGKVGAAGPQQKLREHPQYPSVHHTCPPPHHRLGHQAPSLRTGSAPRCLCPGRAAPAPAPPEGGSGRVRAALLCVRAVETLVCPAKHSRLLLPSVHPGTETGHNPVPPRRAAHHEGSSSASPAPRGSLPHQSPGPPPAPYLPRQPLPRLQPPFSKLRADAAPAPAQFCRPHRALYSTRHSRPEARHNPREPTGASLPPHLRPSATWPTVESRRRLQCHRTASPSPSRRSATPFLFTTGVSGTISGRRQPPAMPLPLSLLSLSLSRALCPPASVRRLCAVATRVSVRAHRLRGQPVHCRPEKGTIIRYSGDDWGE